MSVLFFASGGLALLHTVGPRRQVPAHERHKWSGKPGWGESATCLKCGCIKNRSKLDYFDYYTMPGQSSTKHRPACQPRP